jgi:hypothetical protein
VAAVPEKMIILSVAQLPALGVVVSVRERANQTYTNGYLGQRTYMQARACKPFMTILVMKAS